MRLSEALNVEYIKKTLKTAWLGKELKYLKETLSTNSDAEQLCRNGGAHGSIFLADAQTKGKGRFNRSWFSPPEENLYFSILLIPKKKSFEIPPITLVAAVAIHETLKTLLPKMDIGIKWPNDILFNGKKLSGILSELHQLSEIKPFVVVGIGLNVNSKEFPKELRNIATSLAIECGQKFSREAIFTSLCEIFEKWYEEWESNGLESINAYWVKNSGMVGKSVKSQDKMGIVLGLSDSGALLIEDISGEVIEVKSGEIELTSN